MKIIKYTSIIFIVISIIFMSHAEEGDLIFEELSDLDKSSLVTNKPKSWTKAELERSLSGWGLSPEILESPHPYQVMSNRIFDMRGNLVRTFPEDAKTSITLEESGSLVFEKTYMNENHEEQFMVRMSVCLDLDELSDKFFKNPPDDAKINILLGEYTDKTLFNSSISETITYSESDVLVISAELWYSENLPKVKDLLDLTGRIKRNFGRLWREYVFD